MQIYAHRGASGTEPENTIRSFQKAEEFGVDIELDVRRTKDGEIVVFHDHSMKRLFGVKRAVAHMTMAELKEISYEREIPTLDEVLSTIHTDINIDIKIHGIEQQVLEKIKDFPHKVLISSFYPGVLKKIRALDGNIRLGLIIAVRKFHLLAVANFLTRKLDLYSVHPRNYLVAAPVMSLLRLSGRKIIVWTVNTESEYKRMKKLGVDGVYTDYPELIKNFEQNA